MIGSNRHLINIGGMIVFSALVLGLWHMIVALGLINTVFVASPFDAFGVIVKKIANSQLIGSVVSTTWRMLAGWILASFIGISIGATVGSSRLAQSLMLPTLEALRPLPASAIIPVATLLFGLTQQMSIFVVAFGSLWPMLLATIHGFRNVPLQLREVGEMLEMSGPRYFLTISLPAAALDILPGLKIGLALSLILTVVTEMQASLNGVGYDIFVAQRQFRSADLYAGLIVIGVIGFVINQLILLVERKLFAWAPK